MKPDLDNLKFALVNNRTTIKPYAKMEYIKSRAPQYFTARQKILLEFARQLHDKYNDHRWVIIGRREFNLSDDDFNTVNSFLKVSA